MFSDPLTITLGGTDHQLIRINQDGYSSEYLKVDGTKEYRMRIRHTSYVDSKRGGVKVDRHNAELVVTIFNADSSVPPTVRKTYLVFEGDKGDVTATVAATADGFSDWFTNVNIGKMINWES